MDDDPRRETLYERLRRPPSPHSVPGSLPVLFFGDLFGAQIATVGINPSLREYLDPRDRELCGSARRFQTLGSLHAASRTDLTGDQCESAIATMLGYYDRGNPVYSWFRSLDRVTQAMGFAYETGQAVHLDLVQEATTLKWSALNEQFPAEAYTLLHSDLPFFRWQLATFPVRAVVCNGKTPLRWVCELLDEPVSPDSIARGQIGRVTWYAAQSQLAGRPIAVLGWNIPLTRPGGLTSASKEELGRILGRAAGLTG